MFLYVPILMNKYSIVEFYVFLRYVSTVFHDLQQTVYYVVYTPVLYALQVVTTLLGGCYC